MQKPKQEAIKALHIAESPPNIPQIEEEPKEKRVFEFHELWENKDKVQEFLIPEFLPSYNVAVLIGEDGIGKTAICIQLCFAIAMGDKDFLNLPLNTNGGGAIFIATEDSNQKFTGQMEKIRAGKYSYLENPKPQKPNFKFIEGSEFLDMKELTEEIESILKTQHIELIVIDTLLDAVTQLQDGDINNSKDVNNVLHPWQKLCNKYKTTVLFLHHVAKTKMEFKKKEGNIYVAKNDQLGSSRITGKPRTVLALSNEPKSREGKEDGYINFLHVVKNNLMGDKYVANALELQFNPQDLTHNFVGLTNMEMYTQNRGGEEGATKARKKKVYPLPYDIPDQIHRTNLKAIFKDDVLLSKKDFLERFVKVYDLNQNEFNRKDGYGAYLKAKNFIKLELNHFKNLTIEEDE